MSRPKKRNLPYMTRAYCAKVLSWTNDMYRKASLEVLAESRTKCFTGEIQLSSGMIEALQETEEEKQEIEDRYQRYVATLSTPKLEEVLRTYRAGKILRSSRTIETVTQELTRRSLLGDSNEES